MQAPNSILCTKTRGSAKQHSYPARRNISFLQHSTLLHLHQVNLVLQKSDLATTARACSGYRCRASVIVTGIPRVSRLPDAAVPDTVRAMSSYCIIHRAGYPSSCDVAWTRDEECRSPTHALPSIILTTLNPQSASLLAEPWYTH